MSRTESCSRCRNTSTVRSFSESVPRAERTWRWSSARRTAVRRGLYGKNTCEPMIRELTGSLNPAGRSIRARTYWTTLRPLWPGPGRASFTGGRPTSPNRVRGSTGRTGSTCQRVDERPWPRPAPGGVRPTRPRGHHPAVAGPEELPQDEEGEQLRQGEVPPGVLARVRRQRLPGSDGRASARMVPFFLPAD
jgi:hypothetical protein